MTFRTAVFAHDPNTPLLGHEYRQWPGQWPCGNSIVGKTLFVPAAGNELRADWLVCPTPAPSVINTNVPKSRRIFLVLEPPEYWKPSLELLDHFGWVVTPYQIPEFSGIQIPSVTTGLFWWYGINMDGHKPVGGFLNFDSIAAEPILEKFKILSTITSNKNFLEGHRERLSFTFLLKEAVGDRMDIFGHGFNPVKDKRDAMLPYKYHLAIENAVHPHYWTEKLSDPLLARCKVFYYGATKINDYFSSKSVVPIDIKKPNEAIDMVLKDLAMNDVDQSDLKNSRLKILNIYNFPSFIDRLIDSALEAEKSIGV